ncbi:hypothetical protein BT69DRAFT_1340381 [Atractiella rhizophila]|nr:hypothetical protein BT69DRAFT_1340381 [Atractiella rhizophila]
MSTKSLDSILLDLKSRSDGVRATAGEELRHYVLSSSRVLLGPAFEKTFSVLSSRLFALVNSTDLPDKLAGVCAIEALLPLLSASTSSSRLPRLASYVQQALPCPDALVMSTAARVFAKLSRMGGSSMSEMVSNYVKDCVLWLTSERVEMRRYAACLILRELARESVSGGTSGALVSMGESVAELAEVLWNGLRDQKVAVREAAADAMGQVLRICWVRDGEEGEAFRGTWENVQKGLTQSNPDVIHGSLLALKELLIQAGRFLAPHFDAVCTLIVTYKDSKETLVRRATIEMMPGLASFEPVHFAKTWLHRFLVHLLGSIGRGNDRGISFLAIGHIATYVKSDIKPFLDGILSALKEALASSLRAAVGGGHHLPQPLLTEFGLGATPPPSKDDKKSRKGAPTASTGGGTGEAQIFECIALLTQAVGVVLTKHMPELLDAMFAFGLSEALRKTLVGIAKWDPPIAPVVKERLLNLCSVTLTGESFKAPGEGRIRWTPLLMQERDPELISLALQTLGTFDFTGYNLSEFVRDVIVAFLEDDSSSIRRSAADSACALLCHDPIVKRNDLAAIKLVREVLQKVLTVAIADPDPTIRLNTLLALEPPVDRHLASQDNVRSLFVAVSDENFQIREQAVLVLGRLAGHNPAYVMPFLRQTILGLLSEIEWNDAPRGKEEAANLLALIVRTSQRLTRPYVLSITKVLLPKARDSNPHLTTAIITALGELAEVGGRDMQPQIGPFMDLLIDTLQAQNITPEKRFASLKALGQLAGNAGYVIEPFLEYKALLPTLRSILVNEAGSGGPATRREVVKVLGILGALDPYKLNVGDERESTELTVGTAETLLLANIGPSHEDYYPTITFAALLSILRDSGLSNHHTAVVEAIMYIFKSLRLKCVQFLKEVVPAVVGAVRTSPAALHATYVENLSKLIDISKQHVRVHISPVLSLIQEFWDTSSLQPCLVSLMESIANALDTDFRAHLPTLLPLLLSTFNNDLTRQNKSEIAIRILKAFVVFGQNFQEYIHLALPTVIQVFEKQDHSTPLRKAAISAITNLSRKVNFSALASRTILPLVRVLEVQNSELRTSAMDALCSLMVQMGPDFALFIPAINKATVKYSIRHQSYEANADALLRGLDLPITMFGEDLSLPVDSNHAVDAGITKLPVNQQNVKSAWEIPERARADDWKEWLKRLSIQLLKSSPSHCLRACANLAEVYNPLARELFNAAFVSCWGELYDSYKDEFVSAIESALSASSMPSEIMHTLLNLAEFMEHDDKVLPIDWKTLGAYAQKCHAWAKALHYKELECIKEPTSEIVEDLIYINSALQQPDVAMGILTNTQQNRDIPLHEEWYEKLERWEDALASYERRSMEDPGSFELVHGRMRCLAALGHWEALSDLADDYWLPTTPNDLKRKIAPLAAAAAWSLSMWDRMDEFVSVLRSDSPDRAWLKAILHVHRQEYTEAEKQVGKARDGMVSELASLLGESYSRAYGSVVRAQMLSEIEEIIAYKQAVGADQRDRQEHIKETWSKRLLGCQRDVDTWRKILRLRAAVLSPKDNIDITIKMANLCRKAGRMGLADQTFQNFVEDDLDDITELPPEVHYARLKYTWALGTKEETLTQLREFTTNLTHQLGLAEDSPAGPGVNERYEQYRRLLSRCYYRIGEWQSSFLQDWGSEQVENILASYLLASTLDSGWAKAYHSFALANSDVISYYSKMADEGEPMPEDIFANHLVPALHAFFKTISLSQGTALQDTLRLLTLWFKYGDHKEVAGAIAEGYSSVSIDTWLEVVPQLIARIQAKSGPTRKLVQLVLTEVGKAHPQALVYPLTVASKYPSQSRRKSALTILDKLREHSPNLVTQALVVSSELIRVAILWPEMWHEDLEDASRLYYTEHNITGMFDVLEPLHMMLDKGAETQREHAFVQTYGRDLQAARTSCERYQQYKEVNDLNQAWDLYYNVFRRIYRDLAKMTVLDLQNVSPKLLQQRDLQLAIPGTYQSGKEVISIKRFATTFDVLQSKQHPRKMKITGSDGKDYAFLLKGHEDLRQDERVMQLFGLVNTLLVKDSEAFKRHLSVQNYPVIPLSPNSGLIGWVDNTDTFHILVRNYRESRKVLLNIEHRLMLQMAPDYDQMHLMQKIEVFEFALENTTGQDLYWVLWLKSRNSESWLVRRSNYVRSLATMSMVGHILGLGDRHPANLLMDRITGRIVHVDFGDCFEVAMRRDKYPEKVPFRLTRMLVHAMEVSGVEGTFTINSGIAMQVMRDNQESILAVLEAFVYDPLINWRLVTGGRRVGSEDVDEPEDSAAQAPAQSRPYTKGRPRVDEANTMDEEAAEQLNARALEVVDRINQKLTGRDFKPTEALQVSDQVKKLINQATSYENLCVMFGGWCPFCTFLPFLFGDADEKSAIG